MLEALNTFLVGLYLNVGVGYMDQVPHSCGSTSDNSWAQCIHPYDINVTRNPYGIVELGYESDINKKLSFSVGVRHESSIPAPDYGQNIAEIKLHWHLFR